MTTLTEDPIQDESESQLFLAKLTPFMLKEDLSKIGTAYEFSKSGHHNTPPRKTGERYFNHPRAAALIAIDEFHLVYDWEIISAILLHDILEESFMLNEERLIINFGRKVSLWVKFATKETGYKEWYIPRLRDQQDCEPISVKLFDRTHNLRTIHGFDLPKQEQYLLETKEDYLPLAELLHKRLPSDQKWIADKLHSEITQICSAL